MNESEIIATATIEKRYTGLGTSPSVVKLIPRRVGSISSLYGAKTNLKTNKSPFATSKKKSRIQNGRTGTRTVRRRAKIGRKYQINFQFSLKRSAGILGKLSFIISYQRRTTTYCSLSETAVRIIRIFLSFVCLFFSVSG